MVDFFNVSNMTEKYANAIHNAKKIKNDAKNDNLESLNKEETDDFVKQVNDYQKDNKDSIATKSKLYFDYINQTIGLGNFITILDKNGDKKIDSEELTQFASLDGESADFSKDDIDNLKKEVMDLEQVEFTRGTDTKIIREYNKETGVRTNATAISDTTRREYKYDSEGRMSEQTVRDSQTDEILYYYDYYENGKVAQKMDNVKGTTTVYNYDSRTGLKTNATVISDTTRREYKYDSEGRMSEQTVRDSKTDEILYHYVYNNGNLTKKTDNEKGTVTTYKYDKAGTKTGATVKSGNNVLYNYVYNKDGKVTQKTDNTNGTITNYEYNEKGLKTAAKVKDLNTCAETSYKYKYDNQDNLIERKNERTGDVTNYNYDSSGKLTGKTVTNNGETFYAYTYNDEGQVDEKTDYTKGTLTTYTYDSNGAKTEAKVYDNRYGLKNPKVSSALLYEYKYDNGKVVERTDVKNVTVTEYTYNEVTGQKISARVYDYSKSDSGEIRDWTYEYNDNGTLKSSNKYVKGALNEIRAYSYDGQKIETVKNANGIEISVNKYNADGKVIQKHTNGKTYDYTYNKYGKVTKYTITDNKTGKVTEKIVYENASETEKMNIIREQVIKDMKLSKEQLNWPSAKYAIDKTVEQIFWRIDGGGLYRVVDANTIAISAPTTADPDIETYYTVDENGKLHFLKRDKN